MVGTESDPRPAERAHVWSVGEFTRRLRVLLEASFGTLRIRGQITNLARPRSGHLYFALVDDEGGTGTRFTNAQLPVVIWRSSVGRLRFRPEDGMKVVVTGRLGLYEPRGVYQLVGERIDPEGVGDLQLAFERLKERLAKEGLFDAARKRPLPYFPKRIGLVTSPSGAAIRDFLRVLFQRNPRAWVRLVPVRVQGEGAAEEIARAIDFLQSPQPQVDVVVLTRGGGSLEDLWAFNEEAVARALARSRIPTVSAVGHEVDFTIADFVADYRAPTPTAAAALVSPDLRELAERLAALRRGLVHGLRAEAARRENRLLRAAACRFLREPRLIVQTRFETLDRALEGLENRLYNRLRECDDSLALLGTRLQSLSPFAVLQRGYSVTLDRFGQAVRNAAGLVSGDPVELRFAVGKARARVENVEVQAAETPHELSASKRTRHFDPDAPARTPGHPRRTRR